jgi:hypothetical protein
VADDRVLDLAQVRLEGQQGGVQRAGGQAPHQHGRLVLGPDGRQLGEPAAEDGRHGGQQIGRDRRDHAEPQRAGQGVGGAAGGVEQAVRVHEQAPRALDEERARRGGQHAAAVALEELHAEQVLELGELGAERGLGHAALLGRLAEAEQIGHGHDVLELPQREGVRGEVHDNAHLSQCFERCLGNRRSQRASSALQAAMSAAER